MSQYRIAKVRPFAHSHCGDVFPAVLLGRDPLLAPAKRPRNLNKVIPSPSRKEKLTRVVGVGVLKSQRKLRHDVDTCFFYNDDVERFNPSYFCSMTCRALSSSPMNRIKGGPCIGIAVLYWAERSSPLGNPRLLTQTGQVVPLA